MTDLVKLAKEISWEIDGEYKRRLTEKWMEEISVQVELLKLDKIIKEREDAARIRDTD